MGGKELSKKPKHGLMRLLEITGGNYRYLIISVILASVSALFTLVPFMSLLI